MNRLFAILAMTVLTLLGSGALSAVHRMTHHGNCGISCVSSGPQIVGAARHGCHASACGSHGCGSRGDALPVDSPANDDRSPERNPWPAPTTDDCGFCVLLALPALSDAPADPVLAPGVTDVPLVAQRDEIVPRMPLRPHGPRAPPRA